MKTVIAPISIALAFAFSAPVMAQMNHGNMKGGAMAEQHGADSAMGEGLVKKVDKSKGTVTLAHGAMNGMPGMTMAYRVKEASMLDKLQAGQKVRFATDPADGGMTVTRIELSK